MVVGQLVTVAETTVTACAVCVTVDVMVGVVVTVLVTVAALPVRRVLRIISHLQFHDRAERGRYIRDARGCRCASSSRRASNVSGIRSNVQGGLWLLLIG